MSQYWFARRFPVGHPRKAMAPVGREGWLVVGGFVAAMIVGGVLFLAIALTVTGSPITGAIVFVVIATLELPSSASLIARATTSSRSKTIAAPQAP